MKPEDLQYENLSNLIRSFASKGRAESRSFLNWFLENIFRLDPVEADDCICDKANDRGIDGIYVDVNQEEIIIFQGKVRQKEASIGDSALRELAGTLTQVETVEAVDALLSGGGNEDLKNLLLRLEVRDRIKNGYKIIGAFVSNQPLDANGQEFSEQHQRIRVYDRNRIASEIIDVDAEGGVDDSFDFDISYVSPLVIKTKTEITTYIFPALAQELVKMDGIDDGTLFAQNVRQSLGNTKVNKALSENVKKKEQHQFFPLYHNGVTILCKKANLIDEKIRISQYVVVNGAQSISTFKKNRSSLSADLRVIAKIIEINDQYLAKEITVNSNNQNAIKPRDLKSTNEIQIRIMNDFIKNYSGKYDFEIKRGQSFCNGSTVITNEEAGRLLMAYDLLEPEGCHQVYKIFDDKYSEIFARPVVTADRIVFLHHIMNCIIELSDYIEYKPLSKYGLTRFFLMSVLSEIIQKDKEIHKRKRNLKEFMTGALFDPFIENLKDVIRSIIIDLNYEVKQRGDNFDYKGDLKSPVKIRELRAELLKSYDKEISKGKMKPLSEAISR